MQKKNADRKIILKVYSSDILTLYYITAFKMFVAVVAYLYSFIRNIQWNVRKQKYFFLLFHSGSHLCVFFSLLLVLETTLNFFIRSSRFLSCTSLFSPLKILISEIIVCLFQGLYSCFFFLFSCFIPFFFSEEYLTIMIFFSFSI